MSAALAAVRGIRDDLLNDIPRLLSKRHGIALARVLAVAEAAVVWSRATDSDNYIIACDELTKAVEELPEPLT